MERVIVLLAIFVCLVLLSINQYTTADKVEKLYKIVGDLKEERENNTIPSVEFETNGLATDIKRIDQKLNGVISQIKRYHSKLK